MKEVIDCPAGKERELMANGPVLKNKRVQLPQSKYILEIGVASAYDYLYTIVDNIAGDVFEENHPNDVNGILKDNAGALTMVRAVYVPNADGTWTMYDKFEDMVEAIYSIKPDYSGCITASALHAWLHRTVCADQCPLPPLWSADKANSD